MIEIAKVRVTGANVRCNGSKIPRGMAGAYISVQYDSVWDNLVKTVVFKGSSTIDVVTNKTIIEVPHEVLQSVGKRVYIGFYGTAATGKVIIPTFWAELGTVVESTDPSGDESSNPSLPVYAQLTEQMYDLQEGYSEVKETVNAVNKTFEELNKKGLTSGIVNNNFGDFISLTDSAERPFLGMKLYGKTTQNGTPTPEAPVPLDSVGDDGSVAVTVCGKNLMQNTAKTSTLNGVTFTVNDDGSVTMNGTALDTVSAFCTINNSTMQLTEGVRYTLSGCPKHTGVAMFAGQYGNDSGSGYTFTAFTTASSGLSPQIYIRVSSGTTVNNVVVKPMLRLASVTDTTYEPYKEQTLSISTPNGLPGIPVTSGGNYTDESGQQWICDEVDFEKGVYVQRVANVTFNDATGWEMIGASGGGTRFRNRSLIIPMQGATDPNVKANLLCSAFPTLTANQTWYKSTGISGDHAQMLIYYDTIEQTPSALGAYFASNPMTVVYQMATPIETALSAEELAQYSALHTNYPNTTVFNDKNAGMEVKYVADTKLYIDKKFDQLAAAMLNN